MAVTRFTLVSVAAAMFATAYANAQAQQGAAQGSPAAGGGLVRPSMNRPPAPQAVPQQAVPPPFTRFPSGGLGGVPSQAPTFGTGGMLMSPGAPIYGVPLPPAGSGAGAPAGVPGNGGRHGGWSGQGGWNRPSNGWNGQPANGAVVGVSGSGLRVDGAFGGDTSRVGFHLGAGDCWSNWGRNGRDCWWNNCGNSGWCGYPLLPYRSQYWPWISNSWYYDPYATVYGLSTGFDPFLSYGTVPQQQPVQSVQQNPAQPLTELERADLALRYGATVQAASMYRAYLAKHPDDAGATRSFAIALLDDRRMDQAVAMLMLAYQHQPLMAQSPIDPSLLSGNGMDHRARFNAVMTYANRTKTASSLFAASVLAQSEGRIDVARKLLDRAAAAGLDKAVAWEMRMALAVR